MGLKMREAKDKNGRWITPKEINPVSPLKCACGAQVLRVKGHVKSNHSVSVRAFFRLSQGKKHREDCPYNITAQIEIIARNSEGWIKKSEKGKWTFRLLLNKDPSAPGITQPGKNSSEVGSGNVGTTYQKKEGEKLDPYIHTAQRVLKLRRRCESQAEMAKELVLNFEGEEISWSDFYFERGNYQNCYNRLKKKTGMPIAIHGKVQSIKDIIDKNGRPLKVLNLEPLRKEKEEFTLYTQPAIWSSDLKFFDNYKEGQEIITFGFWESLEEKKDSEKKTIYQNMRLWPTLHSQIFKEEKE